MSDGHATRHMVAEASDVTEAHIEDAHSMRAGEYGGERIPWVDVIDRIEADDEDWGNSMESPAIKYLQREVNRRLREARG